MRNPWLPYLPGAGVRLRGWSWTAVAQGPSGQQHDEAIDCAHPPAPWVAVDFVAVAGRGATAGAHAPSVACSGACTWCGGCCLTHGASACSLSRWNIRPAGTVCPPCQPGLPNAGSAGAGPGHFVRPAVATRQRRGDFSYSMARAGCALSAPQRTPGPWAAGQLLCFLVLTLTP